MMREALITAAQDALDANWRENHRMMATAAAEAVIDRLRAGLDAGSFEEWSDRDLAAQCRMQAHDNLDPQYSRFMAVLADRLDRIGL